MIGKYEGLKEELEKMWELNATVVPDVDKLSPS